MTAYYLPVSSAELRGIQQDAAAATLSLPCEIQRKQMVLDGMGQAAETFVTVSPPNLKCGMHEPSEAALMNFARSHSLVTVSSKAG